MCRSYQLILHGSAAKIRRGEFTHESKKTLGVDLKCVHACLNNAEVTFGTDLFSSINLIRSKSQI